MMSAQDKLAKQILGQGLTGKWSGEGFGSAEANAKDMARILDSIGITDIRQFGNITVPEDVEVFSKATNTNLNEVDEEGNQKVRTDIEYFDQNGKKVDKSLVKTVTTKEDGSPTHLAPIGTKQVFGNKVTGEPISANYDRAGGDIWSGTFAGKGNTAYGVKFQPDGTPIFYTQGASSSDLGTLAPLLSMASFIPGVAPFAQGLNALIAAKSGNPLGAIAGFAGLGGFTDVANAARFASAAQSGDPLAMVMAGANMGGVTDVGGVNLGDVSKSIGAVKAIQSGDPLAMLRYGMGAIPKGDSLTSSLGPGNMDEFRENLIPGYFSPGGAGYSASYSGGENVFDPTFGGTLPIYNSGDESVFDPTYGGTMPIDDGGTSTSGGGKTGSGGSRTPAKPAIPGSKIPGAVVSALTGAAGALGAGAAGTALPQIAQQQTSNADLLNILGSKPELANIKSYKELFGEDLFGGRYVPPSAGGDQSEGPANYGRGDESSTASQSEAEEQLFRGGHVDDLDVDALLQILRS
jgi:hypothetical protein